MHDTAMKYGQDFFETYLADSQNLKIVDIGSQDVNGSLREVVPSGNEYIGVDFVEGKGVDVKVTDPYKLPFADGSIDVVVSSSCFEHSEFFWLLFNECLRVLSPKGLLYINAPSNGVFHRFPVDCWRFYPDSGIALQNWGRRSGYNCALLESFIGMQRNHGWNDFVAVFVREVSNADVYSQRMLHKNPNFMNGLTYGEVGVYNFIELSQDQAAHRKLVAIIQSTNAILTDSK